MLGYGLIEIVISFAVILLALLIYNTKQFSFWQRLNIEGPNPVPVLGNFKEVILQKTSVGEMLRDVYRVWKHKPFIGLYFGFDPILMANHPALIKHILIKDFANFTDRGFHSNEKIDPLSAHLVSLDGYRWKELRSKLSPAFTSGKLKMMYHLLSECADNFEKYFADLVAKGEPIEVKEITAKFTTDVIGSCAFGLNLNALNDEDSEFRKMGRKVFTGSIINGIKRTLRETMPKLYTLLKLRVVSKEIEKFFIGSISETIAYRKQNGIVRHDFVDLLMQIRDNHDDTDFELTDGLLAAQAFVFFIAGFETSATTITLMLYELAQNQEIQKKLSTEIRSALEMHDGKFPYEAIKELKYLDKVYKESLRKHPPFSFLVRRSGNDYTIPDSDITIPAGTKVFVPILGLHYDPQYFSNPEVFDPERFSDEAIQKIPHMAYLPFGGGPRNCIGGRFAGYQTKMGIIKILKDYEVSITTQTKIPYVIEKTGIILSPVGGVYLRFTKIVVLLTNITFITFICKPAAIDSVASNIDTLRKHPFFTTLVRKSVVNYTIPDTDIVIPVSTRVSVSVLGIHYDPQYFPNPEVFDPERFSEDFIHKIPPIDHLSLEAGPRNCIDRAFKFTLTPNGRFLLASKSLHENTPLHT